ncbi:hypothetical protein PVL29_006000 [Vitis rotundifolia]|uniref:Myosin motor domain-containing protein n=1 Tax=Vitis rotundifolia TaxID=103349 RepID=A0AA39A4N7_VITRO|nr:hypothetical protein PVL29_006000 [Vitis rotundifolia]
MTRSMDQKAKPNRDLMAPPALREEFDLKSAYEYKYLKQSNCCSITGVDDAEQFHIVVEALDIVHVSKEDQESVFPMQAVVSDQRGGSGSCGGAAVHVL